MGKRRTYNRRFLELAERMLDKGIVEEREVVVHLPLLDLDVVGVHVRSFVQSYAPYSVDVEIFEVERDADDIVDADDAYDADEKARRLDNPDGHSSE